MKLDRRYALYAFWVILPVALVVRVLQLLYAVDYTTGFYEAGHPLSPMLSIVLVCAVILLALIIIFGSSKSLKRGENTLENPFLADLSSLTSFPSPVLAIASMTMSFALVLDGVLQFLALPEMDRRTPNALLDIAFMVACAVVFLRIATAKVKGKSISKGMGYSLLIPAVWYTIRSTSSFMSFIQIANISEHLLILLSQLGTLLFLVLTARLFAGFEKNNTRPMLLISGLTCALLCAVSTIPRYLVIFFGPANVRQATQLPSMEELLMSAVAISIVMLLLGPNRVVQPYSSDAVLQKKM